MIKKILFDALLELLYISLFLSFFRFIKIDMNVLKFFLINFEIDIKLF